MKTSWLERRHWRNGLGAACKWSVDDGRAHSDRRLRPSGPGSTVENGLRQLFAPPAELDCTFRAFWLDERQFPLGSIVRREMIQAALLRRVYLFDRDEPSGEKACRTILNPPIEPWRTASEVDARAAGREIFFFCFFRLPVAGSALRRLRPRQFFRRSADGPAFFVICFPASRAYFSGYGWRWPTRRRLWVQVFVTGPFMLLTCIPPLSR